MPILEPEVPTDTWQARSGPHEIDKHSVGFLGRVLRSGAGMAFGEFFGRHLQGL